MISKNTETFNPQYAIHPGEILAETLEALQMKQLDFAQRCGLTPKTVSEIINKKAPVTAETSIQFERVLGVAASVWNNLESNYRLFVAQEAAQAELEKKSSWAADFPIKELFERGVISTTKEKVVAAAQLLDFFGIGSIDVFPGYLKSVKVAFRSSPAFKSSPQSVASWLRLGELYARDIQTEPYSKEVFKGALERIRLLTKDLPDDFGEQMKELCRKAGVALVFVEEFKKTHLSGATRWLSPQKALVMLSLRHKSDDHFWFSFFHEAAHILLHGKKECFLDLEKNKRTDEEKEADEFAANFLIPLVDYEQFIAETSRFSTVSIKQFAQECNIAPGIVVGRLQHDKIIPFASPINSLKRKLCLQRKDV